MRFQVTLFGKLHKVLLVDFIEAPSSKEAKVFFRLHNKQENKAAGEWLGVKRIA